MSRDNLEKIIMKLPHALAGTMALTIFSATIPFAAPAHAQAQCAATASGRYAQCVVNPYYAGPNTRRAPRKKHGT